MQSYGEHGNKEKGKCHCGSATTHGCRDATPGPCSLMSTTVAFCEDLLPRRSRWSERQPYIYCDRLNIADVSDSHGLLSPPNAPINFLPMHSDPVFETGKIKSMGEFCSRTSAPKQFRLTANNHPGRVVIPLKLKRNEFLLAKIC